MNLILINKSGKKKIRFDVFQNLKLMDDICYIIYQDKHCKALYFIGPFGTRCDNQHNVEGGFQFCKRNMLLFMKIYTKLVIRIQNYYFKIIIIRVQNEKILK